MVAVIEAEAADDGSFFDGNGGKKLSDCHFLVGDEAVEHGTRDEVCLDLFLFDGCNPKIRVCLGIYLPQVDLAIFLGNEANKMGPV